MARFSTANSCLLDNRTMAAGTSMRCSFGNVTFNEAFPLVAWAGHQRVASRNTRFQLCLILGMGRRCRSQGSDGRDEG